MANRGDPDSGMSLFRQRVRDGSRPNPEPWWLDPSRGAAGWWERSPAPDAVPHDTRTSTRPSAEPSAAPAVPSRRGLGPAFVAALAVLAVLMVTAHVADIPQLSRVLVPVVGLFGTIGFARWLQPRHPDEPWLGRLLILGVLVKIGGTVLRYVTLLKKGQLGDASVYDQFGLRYANAWLGKTGVTAPVLVNLKSSNFLRWFTGIVYYLFGRDLIAGFFVYSLIAFAGSYLWYRAAVIAVPYLDRKLFFILITFAPSIVFWPAGVGKEALMQFGLGAIALGVAYMLTGRMLYGLLVSLPGAYLTLVVRAHLLGLALLAMAFAYVLGRQRLTATAKSSLAKPVGIVVVVLLAAFGVTQGAKRLHIATLSPSAIQSQLEATSVSTTQGHSGFSTNVSLSPLRLPQDAVTVLLRPFPWEVQTKNQILASLEGIGLVGFILLRRRSLALSLRLIRQVPFLFYAWVLTLLYVLLFQAFGNFGLLVRERSIVLPALYVLLALDVRLATHTQTAQREDRGWHETESPWV